MFKQFQSRSGMRLLALVWVQIVCKGYQHATKVTTSGEGIRSKALILIPGLISQVPAVHSRWGLRVFACQSCLLITFTNSLDLDQVTLRYS